MINKTLSAINFYDLELYLTRRNIFRQCMFSFFGDAAIVSQNKQPIHDASKKAPESFILLISFVYIYIYIYIYLCVCVLQVLQWLKRVFPSPH